jgi:hypothetical protein
MGREARRWRCDAAHRWTCEILDGCRNLDSQAAWIRLDFQEATYQRCERSGCDTYKMNVRQRDIFTHLNPTEQPDIFLKVGPEHMFLEVATEGISPVSSIGICKVQ